MSSGNVTDLLADEQARNILRVAVYLPLGFSWSFSVSLGRRLLVTLSSIKLTFDRQTQQRI
jgi:hypothetical protein